jgi:magnesium transporter
MLGPLLCHASAEATLAKPIRAPQTDSIVPTGNAAMRKTISTDKQVKAPTISVPPGTPLSGKKRAGEPVRLRVLDFSPTSLDERPEATLDQCVQLKEAATVTWINVEGIDDGALVSELGKRFGLHPLTIEAITNTAERPKTEEFENYLFAVLKMMTYDAATGAMGIEQVSLVWGEGFVITFLEDPGDLFESVRKRIRSPKTRVRQRGADYLVYALMDVTVDYYFDALEKLGERIEAIDEQILNNPGPEQMREIHWLKRVTHTMRKIAWPIREELGTIENSESPFIDEATKFYFRSVYDHTIQVIDMLESYREILGGLHDIYLSGISHRLNEVMKTLTIIATIFIPLTFVVGVYGMNFEYMPELHWQWGYFMIWGIILTIAGGLVAYFKRQRWF